MKSALRYRSRPLRLACLACATLLARAGCAGPDPAEEVEPTMSHLTDPATPALTPTPTPPPPDAMGETKADGTVCFYVDAVRGKPDGAGTQADPTTRLSVAIERLKAGDTVFIGEGTYTGSHFLPGGEEGKPVTLQAWGDAKPVLTTSIAYAGPWEKVRDNIYAADVSALGHKIDTTNPQVFLDDKALVEARYPNMGPTMDTIMDYRRAVAQSGTNKNSLVAPDDIPSDIEGATAVVWPGSNLMAGWVAWTSPVASVEGRTIRLGMEMDAIEPVIGGKAYTPFPGNAFYVTSALSLLDAPGETFYDGKTGRMYVWLPDGGDPTGRAIRFRGESSVVLHADGKRHIRLQGLTLLGGGIRMDGVGHCLIEDCVVRYADHFQGSGYASYRQKVNMVVTGDDLVIRRCVFGPTAGNGILLGGKRVVFTDNYVQNCNYAGNDFAAVFVSRSTDLEISRNQFYNSARAHLFFAIEEKFERCVIEHNHFKDHATLNSDAGAFYTWSCDGGGTEIRYNLVDCGSRNDNGTMKKLREGLYVDNYSSNFSVHHNIVIGGGAGLQINLPNPGTTYAHNTVIGAQQGIGIYSVPKDDADGTGIRVANNLFADLKEQDIRYHGTEAGKTESYEGSLQDGRIPVPQNPDRQIVSSNNLRGEVDASFRPVADSPALDGGVVVEGLTGEFTGSAPDIGALESGLPMFEYGPTWTLP